MPNDRSPTAAPTLGLPQSFTADDVARLRDAPDLYGGYPRAMQDAWFDFLASLADRIEANLTHRSFLNAQTGYDGEDGG